MEGNYFLAVESLGICVFKNEIVFITKQDSHYFIIGTNIYEEKFKLLVQNNANKSFSQELIASDSTDEKN